MTTFAGLGLAGRLVNTVISALEKDRHQQALPAAALGELRRLLAVIGAGDAGDAQDVRIAVEDTGPSLGGKGLVRMRERAALHQGEVTSGPNSPGGWTVRAGSPPPPTPTRR